MSEDLFYERIDNTSGVSVGSFTDFIPTYGSAVSFEADNLRFDTNDGYFKIIPNGINSLKAKFSLKYQTNEEGAKKLTSYYENSKGVNPIVIRTDNSIYNDITGYCTEYSINHVNSQNYEFNTMLEVLESPANLNWSGLNYLNYEFRDWQDTTNYKKDDIIYAEVNGIKTNNFFYCTEDHLSSVSNSPSGDFSNWSQEFYWSPDQGLTNSVKFENAKHGFGYSIYNKIKKNTAIVPLTYSFSNITTQQLKSMLHFLENKEGYRRFKHQIPSVYNRPKVYYCDSWTHTMVYDNTHNLQVSFSEDPLGVIPKKG
jgi:phage-related protein